MPQTPHSSAPDPSLYNEDLAVVPVQKRTWTTWNYAALWISMSLCIPTYMLASSLIQGGMNWWQAILTIFLGNSIVLVPMILNGRAGARYGISFPVLARSSFGVRGANIPALLKGHRGLWLVWHPDLDRRLCTFPDASSLDAFTRYSTTGFSSFFRTGNRTRDLLFSFLAAQYVRGV
jgi:hypothetical protein